MSRLTVCGVCLLAMSAVASAGPIFLGTQGTTLYRSDGVNVETFTLSADLTSMAVGPDGTIWGSALTDADSDGFRELYKLSSPLGAAPSLVFHSDFLQNNTPTLTWVGSTLYGVQKTPGDPPTTAVLVTIDTVGQTQSLVGASGLIGTDANGSGYDPTSDTFYGIRGGGLVPPAELYELDYDATPGPDPTGTLIGGLGMSFANGGAEFYDGTLYALLQEALPSGPQNLLLGTVDTDTGAFTTTQVVAARITGTPVALVVVPEPAILTLFGLLSFAALRRRRC